MNWIAHLDTMAAIVVAADVASICVSAVFFSERVRRWTHRKRWGSHPATRAIVHSAALAGTDDPSSGSIRPKPITILRNPFDPRWGREALISGTASPADREHSHRPTFRRSTALQQRIAAYEQALADFASASPEPWIEARSAILSTAGGLLNTRFEDFAIGRFQEAQSI
jgi:hypothetical protein